MFSILMMMSDIKWVESVKQHNIMMTHEPTSMQIFLYCHLKQTADRLSDTLHPSDFCDYTYNRTWE